MSGNGNEGPLHIKAKWRTFKHLLEAGIECCIEDQAHENYMLTCVNYDGIPRTYFPDISCKNGYIIEIDGKKGHSSKYNFIRDNRRDALILSKYGIYTIRIKVKEILKEPYNGEINRYGISDTLTKDLIQRIKEELQYSDRNALLRRDIGKYTNSPLKLLFDYDNRLSK